MKSLNITVYGDKSIDVTMIWELFSHVGNVISETERFV